MIKNTMTKEQFIEFLNVVRATNTLVKDVNDIADGVLNISNLYIELSKPLDCLVNIVFTERERDIIDAYLCGEFDSINVTDELLWDLLNKPYNVVATVYWAKTGLSDEDAINATLNAIHEILNNKEDFKESEEYDEDADYDEDEDEEGDEDAERVVDTHLNKIYEKIEKYSGNGNVNHRIHYMISKEDAEDMLVSDIADELVEVLTEDGFDVSQTTSDGDIELKIKWKEPVEDIDE